MRKKVILIIVIPTLVIAGFGAFAKIINMKSDSAKIQYKPYTFTREDKAELAAIKFIQAIEKGDMITISKLVEEGRDYQAVIKAVADFHDKNFNNSAKKQLILYPSAFAFDDGLITVFLEIKNRSSHKMSKECTVTLVEKENQWFIKTSSGFFRMIMPATNMPSKGDVR
jgi:hypothetical protein